VTERAGREEIDNPIERLRLLREDDQAISSYLDRLDLRGPREREMLAEQQEARVRRDRPDGARLDRPAGRSGDRAGLV